ncbi:MAG: heme A synthase [Bacteroidetes bacterium]|nr:heme A synthase [Bacteroidota bacterium]
MHTDKSSTDQLVARWLLAGVFLIIVQILLGGITRLTGSGLSITEWDVITGTLPPLSEQAWTAAFDEYKTTPQYKLLNSSFTLGDFKFIFFWEWFHRFWARMMGMIFLIGFIYFLSKGYFRKTMIKPLIVLFLLGGLQGAVGWIMVASGLVGDAVYVKPTRLALHFILALGLLCYTFWFALQLKVSKSNRMVAPKLRKFTWIVLAILIVQLLFGALMAGHKAATAAPTWPDINGETIPAAIFRETPLLINFIENKVTIHFFHRNIGYLLLILIMAWYIMTLRIKGSNLFNATRSIPMLIVLLQVLLGILSVLTSTEIVPNRWGNFEWMAQIHQLVAMFLLLSLVWFLYLLRSKESDTHTASSENKR